MAPITLAFAVLHVGGGPTSLGIVLAASTLPTVALLLVGGAIADRLPRSQILVVSNMMLAAVQAGLATLLLLSVANVGLITIFSLATGAVAAFAGPATQGMVRQLVSPQQLQKANALVRLPVNMLRVVGPAVGGVLVGTLSPGTVIGVDAASFAMSGLLLLGLPIVRPSQSPAGVLGDIREGWLEFKSRTWLWTYTAFGTIVVALWLAGFQLLGPILANASYTGATTWGLVAGALALGLLAGTVVSLRWKPRYLLAVSVACDLALALPLMALALRLPLPALLASAFAAGVALDLAIVCWVTVMQLYLRDESLGRLTAFNSLGERAAIPLGYLVVGLVSASYSVTDLLVVCAVGIVVCTILNLAVPSIYKIVQCQEVEGEPKTGLRPSRERN